MNFNILLSYVLARLSEASTWATIMSAMSVQFNLHLNPDLNTWVTQLGLCLAAGAGILIKEGWQQDAK